ncbi:single-stranded DNA-binding protein [Lentzea sp. NBRC 102530]|uniref:single-stranded DNA-binding protein n=1 Tax=Lentzea sp. NBRC 102530 TaxID=3032201 RepID=UPI0025571597|nr:single-stranded DNA-binding protein [Lentzea sp. NBRC 102530]
MITCVGTVVSDITYKHGEDGKSHAFFRINSTERRYNTALGEWEDGEVLWLGVTCWRKLADSVKTTLSKGDPVIVQGKLRIRTYEKDDVKRQAFNLDAMHVGLDLSRVQSLGAAPLVEPRAAEDLAEEPVPF